LAPITNPMEMDETLEHVVKKLNASAVYRRQFDKAFGDSVITGQHLLLAITQFVIQLNSSNSKYDQHIRKEAGGKFTSEEEHGLKLFRKNCAACHTEPLFTNGLFENNGLPLDDSIKDLGRMKISQRPDDSLKFKVPTLRNIQYSAPYMHDGRFSRLSQVVNHYTGGIVRSRTLSEKLNQPVELTEPEKKDLIAFLMTLTDREFLLNLRFSYPKESK
jgi:cytochrome c peroxidase